MGGQLDGNFLHGSLPNKFILIVTLIICFVVNKFFSLLWGVDSDENEEPCIRWTPGSPEWAIFG